jgi:hypothetical protein
MDVRARGFALAVEPSMDFRVKLVKQQINGNDRVVLKADATADDLKVEAMRLKSLLGYDVRHDKRRGTYVASHSFFQGKYVLMLAPD